MNLIAETFSKYTRTIEHFNEFHNQVINMPRPTFSEIPQIIKLLKSLSSYILLIDKSILNDYINAKILYENIFKNYKKGIIPSSNRNLTFEKTFLDIDANFDIIYKDNSNGGMGLGRRFRHYTELFSVFNILIYVNKRYSKMDLDSLYELTLTPEEHLFDVFRNRLLDLNINNNSHIKTLNGITLLDNANYRPAKAILRYLADLKRDATSFEIAILFGRIDEIQTENEILIRANKIGEILPPTATEQESMFFGCMGWKNKNNEKFIYSPSQNPDFKFKTFLILMETFDLIEYNNEMIKLTNYSKQLVKSDIPIDMLDLERLLKLIDDDTEDSNKLQDIILRKRTATITEAIQSDSLLVEKLNLRNIRNPIIKNNKRQRSRLIMELAKIKANYLDEVTRTTTFEGKNGYNYVEAHHIIEFNGEDGPDITDNLICLGPQNHSLIHHGSDRAVQDFYNTCKTRGVITFERFKNICVKYHCLTKKHVKILLSKNLISNIDANELNTLIDENGVDTIFVDSLNIPANNA